MGTLTPERARQVRLKIVVRGAVQGVGFRPFIFRLATQLGLSGWVNNSPQGVFIEVEGPHAQLEEFLLRIKRENPPRSSIHSLEASWLDVMGYSRFEIRPSDTRGQRSAIVLPDIATCPDCLREIFDPHDRRFLYPFTNCTNCGPRFSIINALPYDRVNTSMHKFTMCAKCQAEYEDPLDRRFHAQPNACPACGPRLALWTPEGDPVSTPDSNSGEVIDAAVKAIREGRIVALKGLGGFQLIVSAANATAVGRLRALKHREEKPFALMFPSLESVEAVCEISPAEMRALTSPEAPIVLVRRKGDLPREQTGLSAAVAPGNPFLGIMLPYTPLHHLLLARFGFPVVATSGNLTDEPICIDEREALQRLRNLADLFLVHDRPIVRHVDDSIVRIMAGREMVLRRARGYAPLPIEVGAPSLVPQAVLAVGAHLKNTVAIANGSQIFVSQHIGDLQTDEAYAAFKRTILDFERLFEMQPAIVAADLHPDYLSTKYARELLETRHEDSSAPVAEVVYVQHHVSHVLACMAENELDGPVLGVSWDGTGYGLDGTVWGGEFFVISHQRWDRVAHLRPFRLPGGDIAVKEPRRSALGMLFELLGEKTFEPEFGIASHFSPSELRSLRGMLLREVNSPVTSSTGRLFDAVASLLGLRQRVRFEGQAAMELEFAIREQTTDETYRFTLREPGVPSETSTSAFPCPRPTILDWAEPVHAILRDQRGSVSPGRISARFHNSLVQVIVEVAQLIGCEKVVLSGGCFQNKYLLERSVCRLRDEGFRPYWHQRIPPNDGGVCLGQLVAATRKITNPLPAPS